MQKENDNTTTDNVQSENNDDVSKVEVSATDIDSKQITTNIGDKLIVTPQSLAPIGHMTDVVAISNDLGFTNPLQYMEYMVKHSTNSLSAVGDGLLLYQKSRELNIGFTTALENIYLIPTGNGTKTSISVHLAKAMLMLRSTTQWELIKEFEPQYDYVSKVDDKLVVYKAGEPLPPNHIIVYSKKEFAEQNALGKIALLAVTLEGKLVVKDYVTEYKFTRTFFVDGEKVTKTITSRFSLREAEQAGLIKPKGNYEKYPKLMIDHRAFMNGGRAIAPDILLGMYAPAELSDMEGSTTLLDKDGNPIKKVN